jgi:hypothetical protein
MLPNRLPMELPGLGNAVFEVAQVNPQSNTLRRHKPHRPTPNIGSEIASLLSFSWRCTAPANPISGEMLARVAPGLTEGGAAAVAWLGIRHLNSVLSPDVLRIYREAYLIAAAQSIAHETNLETIISVLNDSGVRSILIKGWPAGRLYPEPGLRPVGDIDLWVDPDQRQRAGSIIRDLGAIAASVDLDHSQMARFQERDFEDLYRHGHTVKLFSTMVRVLRKEDQIRILALHFLKHGAWRPVWLLDIAVLLEWAPSAFDWHLCLGSNARRARWIGCTIALAHELLGAQIPAGAPACVTAGLPSWFRKTVLEEWSKRPRCTPEHASLLRALQYRSTSLKHWLRRRWRNPVQATLDCNGSFNNFPRLPYQLRNSVARATYFMWRQFTRENGRRRT